ncbi:MAG: helix-turn-helix transcriptional regulator [Proteobacteria bacterium]|nr:helix-turn-helix transcriptional regulator [Pseudomonadota bacterium]
MQPSEKTSSPAIDGYIQGIADRVKGMRAQRGMTRKHLSKNSDISERYLALIEAGQANISITLLLKLADALGVDFEQLLPLTTKVLAETNSTPLSQFINTLSTAQQEEALNLLTGEFNKPRTHLHGFALIGLRGAGKTTLGTKLAKKLQIPFLRQTEIIESMAGMQVHELFSLGGQAGYRRLEQGAVNHVVNNYEQVILETGGSLVSEKNTYNLLQKSFFTVWIKALPEEHMNRVIRQGDLRPMKHSKESMNDLKLILEERKHDYENANYTLDTTGRSVADCVSELEQCYLELFKSKT